MQFMGRPKVYTACRDCKRCTNSPFADMGRQTGRFLAALFTCGMSEIGFAMFKKCRMCGHQLSLHYGAAAQTPQPAVETRSPLQQMTMMQQPGYRSPAQQFSPSSPPAIATHQQTNDGSTALASAPTPGSPYGATPNPATPGGASAAPTPTPAGWYGDPSGRHQYRYWNGTSWTEQVMSNNTQSVDPLPPA